MGENHTYKTKNRSGIEDEMEVTREEARAIKKIVEQKMLENQHNDDAEEAVYPLGGDNWADLSDIRMKAKKFLRENQ